MEGRKEGKEEGREERMENGFPWVYTWFPGLKLMTIIILKCDLNVFTFP